MVAEGFISINILWKRASDGGSDGGSDVVSVACFGVRVSVMFHLMFVHYSFS